MELPGQCRKIAKKRNQPPLARLAGGMAVLPDEPEELPIEPEPVLPDEPDEPGEPLEGLVEDDPGVVAPELSAALLQPESASAAASANAASVPVFSMEACMSVFL